MDDKTVTLVAFFVEIAPVPNTLDLLRQEGIDETDMTVISNMPYSSSILGRPMVWERLPIISLSGAFVGLLIGLFLNVGTPLLYPIRVGGQPLIPIPPSLVLTFELTMMGLIVSTFLGVLWESAFPSHGPRIGNPRISNGQIGVLFECAVDEKDRIVAVLEKQGVHDLEIINREERTL